MALVACDGEVLLVDRWRGLLRLLPPTCCAISALEQWHGGAVVDPFEHALVVGHSSRSCRSWSWCGRWPLGVVVQTTEWVLWPGGGGVAASRKPLVGVTMAGRACWPPVSWICITSAVEIIWP